MKILIVGATGRTGQQLLDQALAQGHDVAVFVRTPEAFAQHPQRARLRIAQGNVLDGSAVETAVSGQDAVLCALGPRKGAPDTDLTTGTVNIVRAMEKAGVPPADIPKRSRCGRQCDAYPLHLWQGHYPALSQGHLRGESTPGSRDTR